MEQHVIVLNTSVKMDYPDLELKSQVIFEVADAISYGRQRDLIVTVLLENDNEKVVYKIKTHNSWQFIQFNRS